MKNNYKNKVRIEEEYVIKKYNDNVLKIYEVLEESKFNNYPKIIEYNDEIIKYEKLISKKYYEKTSGEEFIKLVSLLHSKTLKYKEIPKDKYKNIYEKLTGNINYLASYYENMIDEIEEEEFMSPSHYLLARNYYLIDSSLKYSLNELKKWYRKQENKVNERVCVVHNKLSLNHYIMTSNNDYLISFEDAIIDTPVLDLYNFYKKEAYKLNFTYLYKIYNNNFELLDDEKILFNVLISIPFKLIEIDNEYLNTLNINDLINYLKNTSKFINSK